MYSALNCLPISINWYYLSEILSRRPSFMSYPGFDLKGRTAVVIGGTSGIARSISHGLAQAGANVVCTSRRREQVEAASTEIEELGRRTIRCVSDVSDRGSLDALLAECTFAFGGGISHSNTNGPLW